MDSSEEKVKKKVKFNPEVSTSETAANNEDEEDHMEKNAIKLLEESILNFKGSGGGNKARRIREEGEEAAGRGRRIEDCVSYYEPYI